MFALRRATSKARTEISLVFFNCIFGRGFPHTWSIAQPLAILEVTRAPAYLPLPSPFLSFISLLFIMDYYDFGGKTGSLLVTWGSM